MSALKLNIADLVFVLKQIKIAEANSSAHAGDEAVALTEVWVDGNGNVVPAGTPGATLAIPSPMAPYGLRTVDGTFNNTTDGRETWGASDQAMPRLLPTYYRNEADGDAMAFGPPGTPGVPAPITTNDYGIGGSVADADPRLISNLVSDMSFNNPAAIVAALSFAEFNGEFAGEMYGAGGALETIQSAFAAMHLVLDNPASTPVEEAAAQAAFDAVIADFGVSRDGNSILIPNIAPDEGLSAPYNAWMTFFGQFFDHGLDLINKGGNGTVYIPLKADDPLMTVGADGIANTGDELSLPQNSHLAFMAVTRATPSADGVSEVNKTTPFVDQNQTYTSNASHQAFLREYHMEEGVPKATGHLLDGRDTNDTGSSLPTWGDVKAQALAMLGIQLTDLDVGNIPVLRMDLYGEFVRGPNGMPQILAGVDVNGASIWVETSIAEPVNPSAIQLPLGTVLLGGAVIADGDTVSAVRTGHAFLDDIAHSAAPVVIGGALAPDADTAVGNTVNVDNRGRGTEYDNELLDQHFITGDGRGNENIGLTAVHHVFHAEHNRQVEQQKLTILSSGDAAFINEWLETPEVFSEAQLAAFTTMSVGELNTYLAGQNFDWDGERLFQAARMATEMQYQHLVFEEFARKIQPNIDPFVFNSTPDINPAIFAEFAHVVYRFGHSMLTDNMPRIDGFGAEMPAMKADGTPLSAEEFGLVASFLNPIAYDMDGAITDEEGAAAIIRGMTIERGNEIDEFLVDALRNNLLGLPLDLGAINIARGRDTGMPSLNQARQALFDASGSTFLEPYANWVDFAANLKHPVSVINFIAAYGTHPTIVSATTAEAKRDAAWLLVMGGQNEPTDRMDFLNATGAYADKGGLNEVDIWIGGLAEKKMPFGGFLGSTFNAVFELQLENLQDGDRFYYLTRTQGQNFLVSLEQNSFAKMMMANTALSDPGADGVRGTGDDIINRHIGVDSFAVYDYVLEVNVANQADYTPVSEVDVAAANAAIAAAQAAYDAAVADHVAAVAAQEAAVANADLSDADQLQLDANAALATANMTNASALLVAALAAFNTANATDATALLADYNDALAAANADPVALRATADSLQATANLTDAIDLRNTANTLQGTADETDAIALRDAATTAQDTADLTEAVALRDAATTAQDTADLTEAVALRDAANTLQDTADLTDAIGLRDTADTLLATANTTDAVLLRTGANQLQQTADQTDAVTLRNTANDLQTTANNTGLQADIDAAAAADAAADAAEQADAVAAAFDAVADAAEAADAAADAADALADAAEADDAAAMAADALADAAEADDAAALAADAEADAAEAADAAALAADALADAAEAADAAATAADALADAAEADDAAAMAADAAADAAENAGANAAAALVALNAALAADAAAETAFTAYFDAADDDAAAMAAQTLATAAQAADDAVVDADFAVIAALDAIDAADAELGNAETALADLVASFAGKDPVGNNPVLEAVGLGKVVRADANSIRVQGGEHVVVGGTAENDTIITDFGDDGIWGDAGDDRIESGAGVDLVNGGAGNDVITDSGDTGDFLKGDEGDDVILGGNGLDIYMGGEGSDVVVHGVDSSETFAGQGNDFVLGGDAGDLIMGNEGDDWLEGGAGFDTTAGDNSELFFDSRIIGHDVMFSGSEEHDFDAESGDDIMVQGESVLRSEGMFGFDWATYKGNGQDADVDLARPIFTNEIQDVLRDRFDKVEAASGYTGNDLLVGDDRVYDGVTTGNINATAEAVFFRDEINEAGIARIAGLDQVITSRELIDGIYTSEFGDLKPDAVAEKIFAGNVLIGGAGDDTLIGKGGNDILDGDRWLNVRIEITHPAITNAEGTTSIDTLTHVFTAGGGIPEAWVGKSMSQLLLDRVIEPSQMQIVREILDGGQVGDVDTAVFWDIAANYDIELDENGAYVVTHRVVGNPAVLPPGFKQAISDGTDTLRNMELVKFGDGLGGFRTLDVSQLIQQAATGTVVVSDLTPVEGQALSLVSTVADVNGIVSTTYQWQSSVDGVLWTDIAGETTANFTLPDVVGNVEPELSGLSPLHNQFIRGVVTITDEFGVVSTFTSTTERVGMNYDASGSAVGVTFEAQATNDVVTGSDFNDFLQGAYGNDLVLGGAGNDIVMGNHGSDIVDGGDGIDTALWTMTLDTFALGMNSDSEIVAVDIANTGAGFDIARNVENLQFGGPTGTIFEVMRATTATTSGGAGSQAIFGRAPNGNPNGQNDTLNGQGASDILVGGAGNDRINGGGGDDWIYQNGATDGRDIINGGAGVDTYTLTGDPGLIETFNIYARAAAIDAGFGAGLNANTEIVITRNGSVIAELNDVEEIKVGSLLPTAQNGNGLVDGGTEAGPNGDTVAVFGNFDAPFTSLLYNTIRINGTDANDTVDISGLQSDHRIVFTTNGGADTVLGTVREQDTIAGSVTDLRMAAPADFGAQDGLDAMVGGEVRMSAMLVGSADSETAIDRTMIETDELMPLDLVEMAPVEPVFVNDAPVDLSRSDDQRLSINDYPVS